MGNIPSIKLILPDELREELPWYSKTITDSFKSIKKFKEDQNWITSELDDFIDTCEVFTQKMQFDDTLIEVFSLGKEVKIPKTYSAVINDKKLFIVSKELYEENYPEGKEPLMYQKLITHELAHELHIRILNGNEDKMGPIWFYEGFAIIVAGQFKDKKPNLSNEAIKFILKSQERSSYINYGYIFRKILEKMNLKELLTESQKDNFSNFVIELLNLI